MMTKPFELKDRTREFALEVRRFLRKMPRSDANREDARQLVRASGSVGANYLEADNALSPRDRLMRLRICLKEARECEYWLGLLHLKPSGQLEVPRRQLQKESSELVRIFASLIRNSSPEPAD